MTKQPWLLVRDAFSNEPIVKKFIKGSSNIYVERYICEPMKRTVPALPIMAMVIQFGGSKVSEGVKDTRSSIFFPNSSAIVPASPLASAFLYPKCTFSNPGSFLCASM